MTKQRVAILVGTRKGAFVFRGDAARKRWKGEGPLFPGEPVYHLAFDARDNRSIWAACNPTWGGPKIRLSRDLGRTWKVVSNPAFPESSSLTFTRAWHIEPGHGAQPGVVWAGVEPAALFRTSDGGERWEPVAGLNEHPTRDRWEAGGGGLALHSIAVDAEDPKHLAVGISAGGVYESRDGGVTWRPWNEATRAGHLPDTRPEIGQCVHHLVAHPTAGGVWFQRNHYGVYWRASSDPRWKETTKGLPTEYGFAGAIHPHDPQTAYVIPLDPTLRTAPPPSVAVYRTADRGRSWRRLDRGLPKGAALEVMREGFATDRLDPVGLYFGGTSGDLWASANEGRAWSLVAEYLPPILSVTAATLV